MNTNESPLEGVEGQIEEVVHLVRSKVGAILGIKSHFRTPRGEVLSVPELAHRLLHNEGSIEGAVKRLAHSLESGVLQAAAPPRKTWTRKERIANYAEKRRSQPRIMDVEDHVANELRKGAVFHATDGAVKTRKANPIRDSQGRIDVLATLRAHGLAQEARDEDDARASRFEAGEIAARRLRASL